MRSKCASYGALESPVLLTTEGIRNMVRRSFVLVLSWCLTISGASHLGGCKAHAGKDAGFVDTKPMANDPTLPFNKVWFKKDFQFASYTKLYVAPVNTSYMLSMSNWQKGEREKDIEKDVAKLATYT